MSKRYIILGALGSNSGCGVASVSGGEVSVSISGTDEEMELYFLSGGMSGERIDAGKIRGGFAKSFELREEDAKKIDGVLLLRDGEPVIFGSVLPFAPPEIETEGKKNEKKLSPLGFDDGFSWLRIEDGRFAENCPMIRHIFENIGVIGRINEAGYYYYGRNGEKSAVAIPSPEKKSNPFAHIAECARYINGYWTVGADKKERCFYSLID